MSDWPSTTFDKDLIAVDQLPNVTIPELNAMAVDLENAIGALGQANGVCPLNDLAKIEPDYLPVALGVTWINGVAADTMFWLDAPTNTVGFRWNSTTLKIEFVINGVVVGYFSA